MILEATVTCTVQDLGDAEVKSVWFWHCALSTGLALYRF